MAPAHDHPDPPDPPPAGLRRSGGRPPRPRCRRRRPGPHPHRPRDRRAQPRRRRRRAARHPHPRGDARPPARRPGSTRSRPPGSPPVRSTRRCTATTSAARGAARWRRPRCRPGASTAGSSSSSTTCCSPAAPSAPRSTRCPTSAGPARSSWRCSSTAGTGSCRSAPTTSARTCRPPSRETVHVLLAEVDGRDGVLLGPADLPARPGWGPTGRAGLAPGSRAMNRHLLSAADLSRDDALLVLDTAEEMARVADRAIKKLPTLRGRTVVNLFFEDSTRTRTSFEVAAKRLSADVINFSAKGSSVSKGESLKDTALTLEAMGADAVVVRHSASGAPHRLAHWIHGSVVNAGDGTHEHPTQALLDAFTMRRRLGRHRGPHGRDRRRRAALPGGTQQRAAARHPRRRGDAGRPADAAAGRSGRLAGGGLVRPRRGAAEKRRRDDAAGAAGADARRVLPDDARVLPALRAGRAADGDAAGRRDRHAPRTR